MDYSEILLIPYLRLSWASMKKELLYMEGIWHLNSVSLELYKN